MASHCDDAHKSTRPSEIKRSEMDVQKVIETFRQLSNPFDMDSAFSYALFSVSSG